MNGLIDAFDDWINSGYDEKGNDVECDICEGTMRWDTERCKWYCNECGRVMTRHKYFDYIGAEPPGEKCLVNCSENYPFCKKYCLHYDIPKDDPML